MPSAEEAKQPLRRSKVTAPNFPSETLEVFVVPVTETLEARVYYHVEATTPEEAQRKAAAGDFLSRKTTSWVNTRARKVSKRQPWIEE